MGWDGPGDLGLVWHGIGPEMASGASQRRHSVMIGNRPCVSQNQDRDGV